MTRIAPCVIARWRRWASRPARTRMILSNAALVGAYWERLLVLPLEQRRVAGREPPSEQRSEGQPGYSEELRVHLRRHRAPITATRPTDLLRYGYPGYAQPGYGYPGYSDTPPTPVLRAMDTQATRDSPLTPPRVTDRQTTRDTLPTPGLRAMDIQSPPALFSLLRFRLRKSRRWLFRRSPFGGLVAWGRVRDRAC